MLQNERFNRSWIAARCAAIFVLMTSIATAGNAIAQAPPPNFGSQPGFTAQGPNNLGQPTAGQLTQDPFARIAGAPQVDMPVNAGTPSGGMGSGNPSEGSEADPATDAAAADDSSIRMNNIISIIREGGVLMIPIILCSIVLLVFVFERAMFLRKGKIIPRPFVRGVLEQLEQQQLDREEAIALCEENDSPIAELFTAALKKWGRPAVEVEQAVLDAGERVVSLLRKYLRLFSAISNLTPLLGLLGTVLGMIDAFNSIAGADAMGRPELLASGIGAALLTTAAGLCVAIPAYAAYAFFIGRVDKLTLEMDLLAQNVVELISAEALQSGSRSRSRARKAA